MGAVLGVIALLLLLSRSRCEYRTGLQLNFSRFLSESTSAYLSRTRCCTGSFASFRELVLRETAEWWACVLCVSRSAIGIKIYEINKMNFLLSCTKTEIVTDCRDGLWYVGLHNWHALYKPVFLEHRIFCLHDDQLLSVETASSRKFAPPPPPPRLSSIRVAITFESTICREPPTHLRLLPVRHFVGIARFLSIPTCTFSVTKIGKVGSSCTRSELVRDDGWRKKACMSCPWKTTLAV